MVSLLCRFVFIKFERGERKRGVRQREKERDREKGGEIKKEMVSFLCRIVFIKFERM